MDINLSDPVWTIGHVAAALHLTVDTAREYTYRAGFPAAKDGFGRNLWLREAVLAWFADLPARAARGKHRQPATNRRPGTASASPGPARTATRPTSPTAPTSSRCVVVAEKGDDASRVEVIDRNGDLVDVQPGAERLCAQGGRGLVIVAAMATAWGVHEHPLGKSVWFTLPTARSCHAEPTTTSTSRMARA
jgi:hypothetical protein